LLVIAIRNVRDVVGTKIEIAEREEFVGSECLLLHSRRFFLTRGGYSWEQYQAGENEDL
jgi:hypothetical protein